MHLWKVMNMSILYKLYLTRMKANIRHVFSRKGSAIFAILMMLLYGGLIVMSLSKPEIALSMQNITDANMAIMIGVGFTALMVGVMLLQKRKALFMEADAFYLFWSFNQVTGRNKFTLVFPKHYLLVELCKRLTWQAMPSFLLNHCIMYLIFATAKVHFLLQSTK